MVLKQEISRKAHQVTGPLLLAMGIAYFGYHAIQGDRGLIAWWNLLTVDKTFLPSWRESKFPGGSSHACELETSLYLYLDEDGVRKDKIKSGTIKMNDEDNPFNWVDLFGAGPGALISWTSSYNDTGVLGDAEKATKEKGERVFVEATKQLGRFVNYFRERPIDVPGLQRRRLRRGPASIADR